MSKFIVGLTGGIGSGKTTVANIFATLGVELIDADIVARQVVEPKTTALIKIAEYFGDDHLLNDGSLDRAKLRSKIFSDPQAKQWLDNLLHPLIRIELLKQLQATKSAYCLLVAPLLIENKLTQYVNRTLVVDVTEQQQLSRTMARDNNNQAQVQNILNSQISRQQRLAAADDVIDNTVADTANLQSQIEYLHQYYLQLSKHYG
ncbi:MAG: dephospho-CoA kinase [Alteromonadaceae bacterium]|nr:dephospho-CoA kinase [Alteromonadaceae bacterium]